MKAKSLVAQSYVTESQRTNWLHSPGVTDGTGALNSYRRDRRRQRITQNISVPDELSTNGISVHQVTMLRYTAESFITGRNDYVCASLSHGDPKSLCQPLRDELKW